MSMTAGDHLLSLFEQAQDKIHNTCNSFEEHFSWLEEAIIAAKQTFYHRDAVLLPKTPAAKKRGRAKRSDSAISLDDGESPSKRSSTESTRSQTETQSPDSMPRRPGRAASRKAQEKVAKTFKESNVRKLRRPSTPIQSTRTIKKTKNTKQTIADRESVEIISKEPQDKLTYYKSNKSEEQLLSSNKLKSPSPSQQDALKIDEIVTGNSGKISLHQTQSSSEETVECYEGNTDAVENRSSERYCAASLLVDESHQKYSSETKEDIEKKLSIQVCSVIGSDDNEKESCNFQDTTKGTEISESADSKAETNLHGSDTCGDIESSNKVQIESVPPVPGTRITRTKQREILPSSSEENLQSSDSSSASSSTHTPPVPKPRSTRTKQKLHAQAESEMEAQMLPPADVPKVISKQKMKENMCKELGESESIISVEGDCLKYTAESAPQLSPKVRSTRTKKRIEELLNDIVMEDVSKSQSTRTKKKVEEVSIENVKNDDLTEKNLESDDGSSLYHSRSTRTKKRQVEEQTVSQPVRSTRTKRQKMEEEASKESDKENISCLSVSSNESKSLGNPVTNNFAVTKNNQTITDSISTGTSEITIASMSENAVLRVVENDKSAIHHSNTNNRITRSKVRQVPLAKKSPKNRSPYIKNNFRSPSQQTLSPSTPNRDTFKRDCCTPKSPDKSTPKKHQPMSSRVASPLRNSPRFATSDKTSKPGRAPFKKCDVLSEVEEMASYTIEVTKSPARVTRHSQGKAVKRESSTARCARLSLRKAKKIAIAAASRRSSEGVETPDSRWARINPQPRTPSPQCPSDKIVRPKMAHLGGSSSHGSSSRITPKTYSRIQLGHVHPSLSSSDHHRNQKKITTPNDVIRTKNIITGVTSFIKVQPAKPTREELEEKKQLELQKKREREEETRKKKEELLKSKAEEQKRRNEERMRRAKELREEKERKQLEAKEQQEKDRRIRDERLKEEQNRKMNRLLAKKQAMEEIKARKLREQIEEERRLEEARKAEETRKLEEARRAEEERKAEQLRLQEEEKRKRIAEVERIARERKEMEQLKQHEEERLASAKQLKTDAIVRMVALNSTFTKESDDKENYSKHNGTFTKSSSSGKDRSDSYEITPDQKKKSKKIKVKNVNDYDICDIKSDDSTDDEQAPKKTIPAWAQRNQLKACLINQEYYPPDINAIFPPEELLTMPDLVKIFPIVRKRFMKRTSSAIWNTPPGKIYD